MHNLKNVVIHHPEENVWILPQTTAWTRPYARTALESLEALNLNGLNVENMKSVHQFVFQCWFLKSLDLSSWRLLNAENLAYMFGECSNIETIDIGNFSAGSNSGGLVTTEYMFSNCRKLKSVDIDGWKYASGAVTRRMFGECNSLDAIDMSTCEMSSLNNTNSMFEGCRSA